MLSFIRKKKPEATPDEQRPAEPAPSPAPPSTSPFQQIPERKKPATTPGVQMLKDVWRIETVKKKKEMPPPGVSSDIYNVPRQRQMPPRHGPGS